jgi:hypothetical protein
LQEKKNAILENIQQQKTTRERKTRFLNNNKNDKRKENAIFEQ